MLLFFHNKALELLSHVHGNIQLLNNYDFHHSSNLPMQEKRRGSSRCIMNWAYYTCEIEFPTIAKVG